VLTWLKFRYRLWSSEHLFNSTVSWVEALDYHQRWLRKRRNDYGKEIRLNLETGMMIPALDYFRA
jgi:hypothetical protein